MIMQPKGKHQTPQNTSSVKQLAKIASTVRTLYCPSGGPLYQLYTHCTAHRGGVKETERIADDSRIYSKESEVSHYEIGDFL